MELILVLILGILASLLANDIGANINTICYWLVHLAVGQAPKSKRTRLEEEWLADVDETVGTIPKLLAVTGFFVAAFKLRLQSEPAAETSDEPNKSTARDGSTSPTHSEFNLALLRKIDELNLSSRSAECVKSDNIVFIGDLIQKSEAEILRIPNCGRRVLNEIRQALAGMGLHLGMDVPNWPPENIWELVDEIERGR